MAKKKASKKATTGIKHSFTEALRGEVPNSKTHKLSVHDYRKQVTMLVTFAVIIGFIFGFYLSLFFLSEDTEDEHGHDDHSTHEGVEDVHHDHAAHAHDLLEIPSEGAPTVFLRVYSDEKAGYNLNMDVTNFRFMPNKVNKGHVDGEGHAHLYINGEKITRLYSTSYYLDALPSGEHTIEVILSSNNHQDYAVNGELISDSVLIKVE